MEKVRKNSNGNLSHLETANANKNDNSFKPIQVKMMTGNGWRWLRYVINYYYCTHLNESLKSYLYDVQIHYDIICKTNNSGNLSKNVLCNMFCNVFVPNSVLVVDCVNGYCLPPISNDYISGENYLYLFWHNSIVITANGQRNFSLCFFVAPHQ